MGFVPGNAMLASNCLERIKEPNVQIQLFLQAQDIPADSQGLPSHLSGSYSLTTEAVKCLGFISKEIRKKRHFGITDFLPFQLIHLLEFQGTLSTRPGCSDKALSVIKHFLQGIIWFFEMLQVSLSDSGIRYFVVRSQSRRATCLEKKPFTARKFNFQRLPQHLVFL